MRSREFLKEYYDEENDNYNVVNIDHKRRPRITLRHLQKLRKVRAIEQIELDDRASQMNRIYGREAEGM